MNNIGLIISGNLTGFSRFYATPNISEQYKDVRIDFDYRNFLTFLSDNEKAYVISFTPTVISVSLVTRILDSFRRPGVLVVTLLIPRHMKVEAAINAQHTYALYQLLNQINDKFYEKNFVNGMVNQNAAVLMQDYYTDILQNYILVSDPTQRDINRYIDVGVTNKRLGYIRSTENDAPLYLSSICRSNYEGYHHVFISPNAPQNIDEPPIEVIYYNVLIKNNNQRLSHVRLADRIPNVRPEQGEIDIEKGYTYQQVINNEADKVKGNIAGDTIELSYIFLVEERTINFVFVEGNTPVEIREIHPMIVYPTGERYNISESYIFRGKEIYTIITIECGNTQYAVKPECKRIDVSRLRDGATYTVYVEQSINFTLYFQGSYSKPKSIVFERVGSAPIAYENVTDQIMVSLVGGKHEDWNYTIKSEYYETIRGSLIELLRTKSIILTPKATSPSNAPSSNTQTHQVNVRKRQEDVKTTPSTSNAVQLNSAVHGKNRSSNRSHKKILLCIAGLLLFVTLIYVVTASIVDLPPFAKDSKVVAGDIKGAHDEETAHIEKSFKINILDFTNEPISSKRGIFPLFLANIKVKSDIDADAISIKQEENNISYKITCLASDTTKKVKFTLAFSVYKGRNNPTEKEEFEITYANPAEFTVGELIKNGSIDIKMNINNSDVELYYSICQNVDNKIPADEYNKINKSIDDKINKALRDDNYNRSFLYYLRDLFKNNVSKGSAEQQSSNGNHQKYTPPMMTETEIDDILGKVEVTESQWKTIEKEYASTLTSEQMGRIKALDEMIGALRRGDRPGWTNLSEEQGRMIRSIFDFKGNTEKIKRLKDNFKKVKSLKEFDEKAKKLGIIKRKSS